VPIATARSPEKARSLYERYECRQSVAAIEAVSKESIKGGGKGNIQVHTGDLAVAIGTDVYEGQNCVQAWAEFGKGQLVELLNAVRNRVLDFSIAVWKEAPTAGEVDEAKKPTIQASKVTQIFNTTVYDGAVNLVGTAEKSTILFEIRQKEFNSLARVLRQHNVSEKDISDLEDAVKADPMPKSAEKFGIRVSNWIAGMMKKASGGIWRIGIGTAAKLLGQAIAKYYGL